MPYSLPASRNGSRFCENLLCIESIDFGSLSEWRASFYGQFYLWGLFRQLKGLMRTKRNFFRSAAAALQSKGPLVPQVLPALQVHLAQEEEVRRE